MSDSIFTEKEFWTGSGSGGKLVTRKSEEEVCG